MAFIRRKVKDFFFAVGQLQGQIAMVKEDRLGALPCHV
jgi:hypothetical protein